MAGAAVIVDALFMCAECDGTGFAEHAQTLCSGRRGCCVHLGPCAACGGTGYEDAARILTDGGATNAP